jgi:hypothetical protein
VLRNQPVAPIADAVTQMKRPRHSGGGRNDSLIT